MPILDVQKIHKTLGKKEVLHGVSFHVNEGEIYGFLGPNGAGKTTTMKCILEFITPEEGSIKVLGKPGLPRETKNFIGYMPENTYLYKYLTGREFLAFNGHFFDISEDDLTKRIELLLEQVWLTQAADTYLKDYSKWMLQRIGIAQSIINTPKLLFLDEPMSGLDPLGRKMVKDLLLQLKSQGTTIFFNTHILSDVESICDRISIINQGNIIVEGEKISDIKQSLEDFFIEQIETHTTT